MKTKKAKKLDSAEVLKRLKDEAEYHLLVVVYDNVFKNPLLLALIKSASVESFTELRDQLMDLYDDLETLEGTLDNLADMEDDEMEDNEDEE